MNTNQPIAVSANSLGSYIQWVNQIPMLSEQEEHDLAVKLLEKNDVDAAKRMIMSHLRLVVKLARGYLGYGLPLADLIQEGNIGLMKAVKRFDYRKGVRLVTFAIHWIRAEIHEFVIRNWRIVKIATTKAQRKLFFNLRKSSKELGWFSDSEIKTVAEELDVSEADVRQMEARMSNHDQSIDHSPSDDADDSQAPVHYLEAPTENPEDAIANNEWSGKQMCQLANALESLDERSKDIVFSRWLAEDKPTLHDLAAKYGVSAERIRQLETNAMKKLRVAMV